MSEQELVQNIDTTQVVGVPLDQILKMAMDKGSAPVTAKEESVSKEDLLKLALSLIHI